MVKQQLWIINSGLIALAMIGIACIPLIEQELPSLQTRRRTAFPLDTKQPRILVSPEKIYINDLFDTFTPPVEQQPTAKNLVTPIPQLNIKSTKNPIKNQKVDFIPPLDITIKGIIMSQDPQSSIVMVADPTGKEQMYHIGDKINDGQVLKITKNQILIIRSNGQQETFFLRKTDKLSPGLSSWDAAIQKIDELLYHIDPVEIIKELTSIGEVIEALDICGAYKNNTSIGLRVGSTKHHPLGDKLGLKSGDVITKINNLPVTDSKERIAVYDAIAALPMGGYIHVTLLRNDKPIELSYLLKRIERPSPFAPQNKAKDENAKTPGEDLFKLSKDSQRQQNRRRFEQAHRTQEQHKEAVSEMRKKMLDEMKTRAPKRRVL